MGQTIEWPDNRRDYGETRIRALGESSGEVLHVVYTRRGDVIRIISIRRANRRERQLWQSRG
ncbi:MAG: BrnT family toxin [Acetobacteraceae bacterium]|nr:BrnT family toxin [Acetobacteraceae bacterium]